MKFDTTRPSLGSMPAVRVENADDLYLDAVLPVVVHAKRFGAALSFVVARPDADRVDMPPVTFGLRVHDRVSVHLAGRGLQQARLGLFGQSQHVEGAHYRSLRRFDRVELVVDRGSRACEVVDFVHFGEVRVDHVMAHQLEVGPADQVPYVFLLPVK